MFKKKILTITAGVIILLMLPACSSNTTNDTSQVIRQKKSDREIIALYDKPLFLSNTEEMVAFWKDYENVSVKHLKHPLSSTTHEYGENTLLYLQGINNNGLDIIDVLQVPFTHFDEPSFTLEEALKIAYSYLPVDILSNYYVGPITYKDIDSTYDTINYYVLYNKNTSIIENPYPRFVIDIEEVSGKIEHLRISTPTRHDPLSGSEWSIDLTSYVNSIN